MLKNHVHLKNSIYKFRIFHREYNTKYYIP